MMETRQHDLLLLDDVVQRTVVNPTASHGWHQMIDILRRKSTPALAQQLEQFLLLNIASDGLPGFYRASFLDMLTGKPEYLQQAGQIVLGLQPFDPDRVITFLQNSWQRVLLDASGRQVFQQRLMAIGLPKIAHAISLWSQQNLLQTTALHVRKISQIKRLALIAPALINIKHPPTLMALQQAECLRRCGYEVVLYSAQEMLGPDFQHYLGSNAYESNPQFSTAGWERYLGVGGQLMTGDSRFSLTQRFKSLLNHMAGFDPDLVMSVGLYSGLAATVHPLRPILSLGINSLSPMVPADVWLTAQREFDQFIASPWDSVFPLSQGHYHPYRLVPPVMTKKHSRTDLGWPDDGVVMITLLSDSNARIKGEWAAHMVDVLTRNPQLSWIIVGGNGDMPAALHGVTQGQVKTIPFCIDAVNYLPVCDIYVNPPMMGGGFAVAEAMALGLPVLSFSGSDGGDKLGTAALASTDAYFARLDAWICNRTLRQQAGQAMQQHFVSVLDLAQSSPSLQAACELAVQRFHLRAAASIS
ncbi:glycosyltransferase [Undibacterium sp. TJN19]|uniref:glycosyltransferase n=1 Tax=Undibacterium sp. TJN19 TaxID=3413055 RepID=UPI003BF1AADA